MATASSPHFVLFPFMSQGHTIPLLYLARFLRQRLVNLTIFSTPANSPAIRTSLHDTDVSIIDLPFPKDIAGLPPGVENTDKLPSLSSFPEFANATKFIQPRFEEALEKLRHVSCIISDSFLPWTQESAAKLRIPRLVFNGINNFSMTMYYIIAQEQPNAQVCSDDEPFPIPNFPNLNLTVNDIEPPFCELGSKSALIDFLAEQATAMSKGRGLIVNSFYELEPSFNDYWNRKFGPTAWCVGPLCLAKPKKSQTFQKPTWIEWLDEKLAVQQAVLYVAFGTQADISLEQLHEIALGLEQSKVSFMWALRPRHQDFLDRFEERVKDRGLIVKEWVDQMEILQHDSIQGFLSHCGWNSVLESICAGVPILALPLIAEQHLNARLVVEVIGVGLRISPSNGSVRGFVKSEEVEKMVKELMHGEKGAEARKKVEEVGVAASRATEEGGSSWCTLNQLIEEVCRKDVESPICK
ncbi:hypothetical protein RJ640_005248 [Escallonia rubra]|uniref:Glycosyltransferase n=1 Tax=Escallonia rubra TaxID=112253 RepID=A0AA88U751_9ASTE|nr:hypothetical protein RJ640_005248 [Escallonia rubra]